MRTTKKAIRVEESCGNVFADLGLPDAREMLIKAELAHRICQAIDARGFTQAKAASAMGLDQPKISALVHGRLRGFSVERLFRCLNDLGQQIEITIRPIRPIGRRGDTHVVAAT